MRKLVFENVGRNKWNGSINIPENASPDDIAEYAQRESRKHLLSRFPDTVYDASENKGEIQAGWNTVGYFHVEKSVAEVSK